MSSFGGNDAYMMAVARALTEFVSARNPLRAKDILSREQRYLPTDAADSLLETYLREARGTGGANSASIAHLERQRALLRRCREVGIEAATKEAHEDDIQRGVPILQAITEFVDARTLAEKQAAFERQRAVLLSEAADEQMRQMAFALNTLGHPGISGYADRIEEHRRLLQRSREVGFERAWPEFERRLGL